MWYGSGSEKIGIKTMEKVLDKLMSGATRAEYIEVEPNVRLHVTDAGEGRPVRRQKNNI